MVGVAEDATLLQSCPQGGRVVAAIHIMCPWTSPHGVYVPDLAHLHLVRRQLAGDTSRALLSLNVCGP